MSNFHSKINPYPERAEAVSSYQAEVPFKGRREQNVLITRRQLFSMMGWGGILASLGGTAWASYRFLFPEFLYEPPTVFKIGRPSDFGMGVTETLKKLRQIWVVRKPAGISQDGGPQKAGIMVYVSICRHLGCTPNWFEDQQRFRCPCHGSIYDIDGNVVGGPAPRTLWRAAISLADDGQILVDFMKRQDPDVKTTSQGLFSVVPEIERQVEPFFIPEERFLKA